MKQINEQVRPTDSRTYRHISQLQKKRQNGKHYDGRKITEKKKKTPITTNNQLIQIKTPKTKKYPTVYRCAKPPLPPPHKISSQGDKSGGSGGGGVGGGSRITQRGKKDIRERMNPPVNPLPHPTSFLVLRIDQATRYRNSLGQIQTP